MDLKRITIVCGHYGSGKTNVALNFAFSLRKENRDVVIADLDIVNPYFRTKDSIDLLEKHGIPLICSDYAGSNVDIPALPAQMYALTQDKTKNAVLDIGGDDRGALALGRLAPDIIGENNYEMLAVINCYRPLTADADATIEILKEIEFAAGIRFTGLVNNSNLGEETSAEDVLTSQNYAKEIADKMNLPIRFTCVSQKIYDDLAEKIDNLLPLVLQEKYY